MPQTVILGAIDLKDMRSRAQEVCKSIAGDNSLRMIEAEIFSYRFMCQMKLPHVETVHRTISRKNA